LESSCTKVVTNSVPTSTTSRRDILASMSTSKYNPPVSYSADPLHMSALYIPLPSAEKYDASFVSGPRAARIESRQPASSRKRTDAPGWREITDRTFSDRAAASSSSSSSARSDWVALIRSVR